MPKGQLAFYVAWCPLLGYFLLGHGLSCCVWAGDPLQFNRAQYIIGVYGWLYN